MKISIPRVSLTFLPTPVTLLENLSRCIGGPRIFIKRDDLTGLAGGGNKVRKLEFLIADALARNADTVLTVGAAQSNHCRQTAAAAARHGLRCILVLRGHPPRETTGNLLLDFLLGAEVRWSGKRGREEVMQEIVAAEREAGRNPYPIPLGGSTPLGAVAYALALEELLNQSSVDFDRIFFASSSGGTQAGLVAGARLLGYRGEIFGISVDEPLGDLQEVVADIATGTLRLLGDPRSFGSDEIIASDEYLGEGYGIMGTKERQAIDLFAQAEGILLDPVYTGRAAAGMIDLIHRGVVGKEENVLFWHTGGTPALWAYAEQLVSGRSP